MAPAHAYVERARGPRLQKVLADAGVGSRRACEALIESGEVTVNGTVVDSLPAWVDPTRDRVVVQGRPVAFAPPLIYVMLFKPRGVVTTNHDPEGRRRAIDLVDHPSGVRLFPVGRLDLDSSGLLLLTNDGELANRLTHPRYEMHKVYEVTIAGTLAAEDVQRLEAGLFLPDRRRAEASRTAGSKLSFIKRDGENTKLRMELREGRNRQIRRMFADLGHNVRKLRRVQMGPLQLKSLAVGQWRALTPMELSKLRRAAFRERATETRGSKVPPKKTAKR